MITVRLKKRPSLKVSVSRKNYSDGIEQGKRAEYDRFWDAYQQNGNRTNYSCGFSGIGWTDETFKPKYIVRVVGSAERMFYNNRIKNLVLSGVADFSAVTDWSYTFTDAHTESIDFLDLSAPASVHSPLYYVPRLHTIGKVKLKADGSQSIGADSFMLDSLVNIAFEGTIGSSLNFHYSNNLSKASITSIINALSSTASGKTLTLKQVAVTNAFGSTTASAWTTLVNSKKNWTISLV